VRTYSEQLPVLSDLLPTIEDPGSDHHRCEGPCGGPSRMGRDTAAFGRPNPPSLVLLVPRHTDSFERTAYLYQVPPDQLAAPSAAPLEA